MEMSVRDCESPNDLQLRFRERDIIGLVGKRTSRQSSAGKTTSITGAERTKDGQGDGDVEIRSKLSGVPGNCGVETVAYVSIEDMRR